MEDEVGKNCVIVLAFYVVPLIAAVLVSIAVGLLVAAWAGLLAMAGFMIVGVVVSFVALRRQKEKSERDGEAVAR